MTQRERLTKAHDPALAESLRLMAHSIAERLPKLERLGAIERIAAVIAEHDVDVQDAVVIATAIVDRGLSDYAGPPRALEDGST